MIPSDYAPLTRNDVVTDICIWPRKYPSFPAVYIDQFCHCIVFTHGLTLLQYHGYHGYTHSGFLWYSVIVIISWMLSKCVAFYTCS